MTNPINYASTLGAAVDSSALETGTGTSAGTLTGTEVLAVSRGAGAVQTTTGALTALTMSGLAAQRQSIPVLTAGQAAYVTSGYTPGLINIFIAGIRTEPSKYQATDGTNVIITDATILASLVPGMTVDIDASITLNVANVATVGSVQALDPANQPAVGTLTGAELMSVKQSGAFFQSTLSKIAQFAQSLTLTGLGTNSGAAAQQGASLIGWDTGTIGSYFKNYVAHQLTSFSSLATTDVTKYLQCFTQGYYASGDGGHAAWVYSAATPAANANGLTIVASTFAGATGCWIMLYAGSLDVRALGMVVDGVTSNGTLLNTIIQTVSNVILRFPGGTCLTGTAALKTGVSLEGQGSGATTLLSDGTCTNGLLTGSGSVIQKMHISGMTINGHSSTSPQAVIQIISGTAANGSGWWYSTLNDLVCGSFLYGIWLDGGSSTANNPIQFITFKNVVTRNALRCYGRVEHLEIDGGLFEYNSATGKSTGDCILLQQYGADFTGSISGTTLTVTAITRGVIQVSQSLNASGVTSGTTISSLGTGTGGLGTYNLSASFTVSSETMTSFDTGAPTNVSLVNASIQNGQNGIHAIGASRVDAIACDFENLDTSVLGENGAVSINVLNCSIRNAANNSANTGAVLAGNNGTGVARDNFLAGTVNYIVYNYANNSGGVIDGGGNISGLMPANDGKTTGMTVQINATATIAAGRCKTVIVNTGSTAITTITSGLAPGEFLMLRAFGAAGTTVRLSTGGNIAIPGRTDVYLLQGQAILLVRIDLTGPGSGSGYLAVSYPENRVEMNSGTVVSVPTTGTTVTVAPSTNSQLINPAGALAALSVQFPVPLGDGHPFELAISQAITTLSLLPNSGATIIGGLTTTSSYTTMKFRYNAANTLWYRVSN
jgi:hypothetical protein